MSAVAETVEKAPRGGRQRVEERSLPAGLSRANVEGWDFASCAWERRGEEGLQQIYNTALVRAVLLHAVSTHVEEPLHDFLVDGEG